VTPVEFAGAFDAEVAADVGAEAASEPPVAHAEFLVRLTNFEGPFDLLLALIGRRRLDVTEIALSQVTDDFLAHVNRFGAAWDLGQATQFLVVAATLLDLKTARLLPAAEVEDDEDVALLEARDLLFARLLQYRAYKLSAAHLAELIRRNARRYPRTAALEPRFAAVLPEVELGVDGAQLARLAEKAMTPRPRPQVAVEHVHAPRVSVAEHMAVLAARLRIRHRATFAALVADCPTTLDVVARFLALLELYRDGSVGFDQPVALSELMVQWTGAADSVGGERSDVDEEYR
jgi:segregation and condensation protein A